MNINEVDPEDIAQVPQNPTNINQVDPSSLISPDQQVSEANEAKYGTLGQQLKTGVEGFLQGTAGPLATKAETGLGIATPEDIRGRAETNPWTHGLSEAGGFGVGLMTGTGEAAAVGKLGDLAASGIEGASTISKIAQAGARTATEMAALQAGDETSKMITNDPNQSLGSAAINIGLSGVIGGAGGSALGSVGPLWKATFGDRAENFLNLMKNKMDGQGLPVDTSFETFLKTAEDQGIKIDPEIKAALSNNSLARDMFKTLRESGSSSGEALVDTIEKTKQVAQDQIAKVLGENGPSAFEAGETAKKAILDKADQLNENVRNQYNAIGDATGISIPDNARLKFYDKIIEDGQHFGANGSPSQDLFKIYGERALSQDTIGQLDKLNTEIGGQASVAWRAGDNEKYRALAQIRDSIREFQDAQIGKAVADVAKPLPMTPQQKSLYGGPSSEFIEGNIEHQQIAQDVVAQRQAARKAYADFMTKLSDMGDLGKVGSVKNYSQFQEALTNKPSAKLAASLFDKKNIEGLRALKEQYPDVFDTLVQQQKSSILENSTKQNVLNHNTVLNKIGSLPKEVKSLMFSPEEIGVLDSAHATIRQLNTRLNPSGTAGTLAKLYKHMAPGAGAIIGALTGGGLFKGAMMGEAAQVLGRDAPDAARLSLLKFLGSDAPVSSEGFKSAFDYISSVIKGQKSLNNATKNFFKAGAEILPLNQIPTKESREKLQKSLDTASESPSNMMKIGGSLGHYLPDHSTAAAMTASTALNYLNSLKPQTPTNGLLDKNRPVDKIALQKYNQALDIAQQPLLTLQLAKKGTLSSQDVTTLKTIYPGLYPKIVSQIQQELVEATSRGQEIPYQERIGLSALTGQPVDSTMTPQSIMAILSSSQNKAPESQMQPGKPRRPNAQTMKAIDTANSLAATPIQQRLMNAKS